MRRLRLRLIAVGIVLTMLLPAGALAGARMFCRMGGNVTGACCCKARADRSATPDSQPSCGKASCCELRSPTPPAVSAGEPAARVFPAALVAIVAAADLIPTVPGRAAPLPQQARAPPSPRAPKFLDHCALLI
jgi:hypothetical protein